jgi:hypothetical protein
MAKEAAITVRVPVALKARLAARAKRERRSLSAQVVHELEAALGTESVPGAEGEQAAVLGLFDGARLPTERDFAEVRALLWGPLGRRG